MRMGMEEGRLKPRNHTLACIAKNDPTRFRQRVVETERRKVRFYRARRKVLVKKEKERDE